MSLFYEFPSDLLSFSSPYYYPTRRSVYHRPAPPTMLSFPFELVENKPQQHQQHVLIKKRQSGELKIQEDGERGWFAQVTLPGVKNVELELQDNNTLVVQCKVKGNYQTVLINYTLQVPEGVDQKQIKGVLLNNGSLKISLPKLKPVEEEKPKEPMKNSTAAISNKLETPFFSIWQRCLQSPKETSEDTETHHVTRLELPEGFNKENLDIEFNRKGVLTIAAQRKDGHSTISFRRLVALPKNLTENDISAKFEGNTLEIRYPKATPSQEKSAFKIQIAGSEDSAPPVEEESTSTVSDPATKEEHGDSTPEPPLKKECLDETHNDADAANDFEIVSEDETVMA